MKLEVRVSPRSSKEEIIKLSESSFKVYMHETATEGRANKKLIEMLAEYFNVKKSSVNIIRGLKSKQKTVTLEK